MPKQHLGITTSTSRLLLLRCLARLLNTFQSTLDEVSIIALPQYATAGTAGAQLPAAQRYVKLQSFYDPAKGE